MVTMSSSSLTNQQQNQPPYFYGVGRAGLLYAAQRRRRKKRRDGPTHGVSTRVMSIVAVVFGVLLLSLAIVSQGGRNVRFDDGGGGDDGESTFRRDGRRNEAVVQRVESRQENMESSSPVVCSREMNLYCPPQMKCCPKYMKSNGGIHGDIMTVVGYTCLAASKAKYPIGSCCDDVVDRDHPDDLDDVTGSGCSIGYVCAPPRTTGDADAALPRLRSPQKNDNSENDDDGLANIPHCRKDETPSSQPLHDNHGHPISFEYLRMPRYHTCPAMKYEHVSKPHGLKIPREASNYGERRDEETDRKKKIMAGQLNFKHEEEIYIGQLAYFTNRGTIDDSGEADYNIKTAVITIHGSSRVSTNYLCFMIRAVKDYVAGKRMSDAAQDMQQVLVSSDRRGRRQQGVVTGVMDRYSLNNHRNHTIRTDANLDDEYLVIAPWFLAPQDGEPETSSSLPFLKWDDDKPISHTFRYGAESTKIDQEGHAESTTISSFAVMDALLETLCAKHRFPNLERIVIAGHSAGGQFVHRWGLSSNSWCFQDNDTYPSVRLIAANPRSYAYLDGRRYFPTHDEEFVHRIEEVANDPMFVVEEDEGSETVLELRPLTLQERNECPEFDSYEWGLHDNPNLPAPYVLSNIAPIESRNEVHVFCRYAARDVVYLSGERDVEELGNQICNQDGYQGPTRIQRSERFYSSLQVIGKEVDYCRPDDNSQLEPETSRIHERVVVKNVGHDHALIYVAEEGQRVLFD